MGRRPTMRSKLLTSTCLAFLAVTSLAAADQTVAVPSGWKVCGDFFAARSTGVAVVLYPASGEPVRSKILQVQGSTVSAIDVPGKVVALEYSPNGSYLLAKHLRSEGPAVTSFLSASTGTIVWSRPDTRSFHFSGTGAVVYAVQGWSENARPSNAIEMFSLQGGSLRRTEATRPVTEPTILHDPSAQASPVPGPDTVHEKGTQTVAVAGEPVEAVRSPAVLTTAAILDDGRRVVEVADQRLVIANTLCAVPEETWSARLQPEEGFEAHPLITRVVPLSGERFLLTGLTGRFKVVRADGVTEYVYQPSVLDAADATRTLQDYASYLPFKTANAAKLLLFRGSSDALLLDIPTGALEPVTVNVAAPEGFRLVAHMIVASKMLFFSPTQILIRETGH